MNSLKSHLKESRFLVLFVLEGFHLHINSDFNYHGKLELISTSSVLMLEMGMKMFVRGIFIRFVFLKNSCAPMVPLHDSTICRLLFLNFAFGILVIAVLAFGIVSELKVTIFGLSSYVEVMFSV